MKKNAYSSTRINFLVKNNAFDVSFGVSPAFKKKIVVATLSVMIGVCAVYDLQKFSYIEASVVVNTPVAVSAPIALVPVAKPAPSALALFTSAFEAKKVPGVLDLTEEANSREVLVTLDSDAFFESGSAKLLGKANDSLQQIEDLMKNVNADAVVEIEGHTDASPVVRQKKFYPSNWELSAARAASLIPMFERAGIKKDKLRVVGYGDSRPLVSEREPASAKNRRIVFRIFPLGESPKNI